MDSPKAAGRQIIIVMGALFFISSHFVRAASAQAGCVPNCVSILDLAGPQAAEDLRGLANLVRDRVKAAETGKEKLDILNHFFFDGLRFEVEEGTGSIDGLLPSRVLPRRRGTCVGLSGVYLALGDLLDMPLAAVSTPTHIFVRFNDGHASINVELLQAGKMFDDDWYVYNHKIPESSISSGVFLKSLSERDFLGYVYSNLGALYSKIGDFSNSQVLYKAALRNIRRLPTAYYNLGNDLLAQARYRQALHAFDRALDLYPIDIFALNNRGIALCKLGKTRRAHKDFQTALDLNPSFAQARSNLSEMRCDGSSEYKH